MRGSEAKRVAELVVGAGIAALLTMAAVVYVGRTAGPAEYSDFSAALAVIYFVPIAFGPVVPAIARIAARFHATEDMAQIAALRRTFQRGTFVFASAVVIVIAALRGSLANALRFRSAETLVLAVVFALLYISLSIDRAVLQGLFRFREYNANLIVESGVRLAALLAVRPTALVAIGMWVLAGAIAELVNVISLRSMRGTAAGTEETWAHLRKLIGPIAVVMVALAVFQNTDMLAVKRWFAPEQAGAYGAASSLMRGFAVIFGPFLALAGPVLTQHHGERRDVFGPTWCYAVAFLALSVVPLALIVLWPQVIITLVYGKAFVGGATVLAPLAGITVATYTGVLVAQALITVHDFRLVYWYALGAVAQPVALTLSHGSFGQVLTALYVVQGAVFLCTLAGVTFGGRRRNIA